MATERIACYVLVIVPWTILYGAIAAIEWTGLLSGSAYLAAFAAPLAASARRGLRQFAGRALLSLALALVLYLAASIIASPYVIWALLAAEVCAGRTPRLKWVWRGWAILVAANCVANGRAVIEVAGGFAAFGLAARAGAIWEFLRRAAEWFANSWREWQWRGIRGINHGLYAGAGAFVSLAIVGTATGPEHTAAIMVAAICSLAGAALWAQYVEGSPQLLRPYGYYGGVIGCVLGSLAAPLFGTAVWLLLAAYSLSGPWVQSLGRLRCLVQGCCHGRPARKEVGIRYRHPRSRVCRLTEWRGIPLHPTPLYSILWNVLIALVLGRLWLLGGSLALIAGLYLILNGLGRFVEEAYRGEPQTPVIGGLRFYQWLAVASVLAGVLVTMARGGPAPALQFRWNALLPAAAFGLAAAFALGVDFPNSNRRFSRLT